MAIAGFKVIDADGHVTEPATLYKTHIDPKFRAGSDDLLSRLGAGNLGIVPALYPKWRSAERPLGDAQGESEIWNIQILLPHRAQSSKCPAGVA